MSKQINIEKEGVQQKAKAYYFAYGSNLNLAQIQKRCPSSQVVGKGEIEGRQLTFGYFSKKWGGSVASLKKKEGGRAVGVVFSMTPEDLQVMDGYEGHKYERFFVDVHFKNGQKLQAQTYRFITPNEKVSPPTSSYVEAISKGYSHFGLDYQYLTQALFQSQYTGNVIFVYGSLKSDEKNHYVLQPYQKVAPAKMKGTLYSLPYGYPALLLHQEKEVYGELVWFENLDKRIKEFDDFERVNSKNPEEGLYERILVDVVQENGESISAWCYVAGAPLLKELQEGIGQQCKDGRWSDQNS